MKKLCLFVIVVGGLITPTTAEAREKTWVWRTTNSHPTVLSVLLREKCDPLYISQVLRESGIKASDRNNIPIGTLIRLTTRSCHLPAPAAVARASAPLLPRGQSLSRTVVTRGRQVARRPSPPTVPRVVEITPPSSPMLDTQSTIRMQSLVAENRSQSGRLAELEAEIRRLKTELASKLSKRSVLLIWITGILLGLLLGLLLATSRAKRREQDRVSYDKVITIERDGVKYPFDFVDAREVGGVRMPTYCCAGCSEMVTSLERHALYRHAGECPAGKMSATRHGPV